DRERARVQHPRQARRRQPRRGRCPGPRAGRLRITNAGWEAPMTGFVLRRILSSSLVIVLTSMFVFVLFFVGMGDRPAEDYCGTLGTGRCTPLRLASIERDMGLDQSVVRNYGEWVQGVFVGRKNVYMDGKFYHCPAPCLGISITSSQPVSTELE